MAIPKPQIKTTNQLNSDMDFKIFETRPGIAILLLPDSPSFTVVAVSDGFLHHTGTIREKVVDEALFNVPAQNARLATFTAEQSLRKCLEEVLITKRPNEFALQHPHTSTENSGPQEYWRAFNTPLLNASGEIEYIIYTIEDFTLHKEAEQKSESLQSIEKAYHFFMSAPVIIGLLLGDDYKIEMANEGLLQVWGRSGEVVGQPLFTAIPELESQGFSALLEEVRCSGQPFYAYEFPIMLNRSGHEELVYFDFVYKPFYEGAAEGKAQGVFSVGHDVTSKVLARQEMEASKKEIETQRRLYETINGSTPDLICVFDLNYRFQYANPALLNMWGKTSEEAIGKSLLEIGYEPWHAEMHEREIDRVLETKTPIRGEVSFPHASLGKRIYDYIMVPVLDEAGTVSAVAATTRDITDIKKAEQSLLESNGRFRNLADESPMFVFIIESGPGAPVSYWNRPWLEYTGQTAEEASGRSWEDIIHPDDVEIVIKNYAPAFENGTAYIVPAVRVKRFDNEYRWHSFKGNPRHTTDGRFNGYVGVGFDVHDQKLAEDALKENEIILQQKVTERTVELESQKNLFDNILKNSSNGITVSEMIRSEAGNIIDARTIMANDAAIKFVGLPRETFLSLSARDLDPGIMESDYGQTCLNTLRTGEPALSQYFIELTGRWQELTISKMDEDHLIHIFSDVTPIKEAQLQLEHTIEELKRSNTNLEEFAYAASHDLKEPIRKIQVFLDRLKITLKDKMDETDRNFFHRMEQASARMNTLIDDLLDYSYVSKGAVLQDNVDLSHLTNIVLEDLDMEIDLRKAEIEVGLLPVIKGNKRQLQQLLQNLISNAIKYNRPDSVPEVRIVASLIKNDDPMLSDLPDKTKGDYHLIEIQDNGIGFEQEDAERIFTVFTRLHGNAEYKGSGVGLSIVRKVVENHLGQIWAEGNPGAGATFKLLLPA